MYDKSPSFSPLHKASRAHLRTHTHSLRMSSSEAMLARQWVPRFVFHPDEPFFPISAEEYLEHARIGQEEKKVSDRKGLNPTSLAVWSAMKGNNNKSDT